MKTLSLKLLLIACVILNTVAIKAEGTKQFRPASGDVGNIQVNDVGRPFALYSNTDSLHRLYIRIGNIGEKIYFGFQHTGGGGGGKFRIKNPSGAIVYAETNIPTSGSGYISTYAQAVAGPKIGGSPAAGYTPLSYTPVTTGDFYIEFTTTLTSAYHFDLFDITVVNSSNVPINGRLWSYAWDLNTRSSGGRYNGSFYIYTADHYVTEVDLNGMQPYGFVISSNSTGPENVNGNGHNNRKSKKNANSTRPEYKIFLNMPDTTQFPIGTIPTVIENLEAVINPEEEDQVMFTVNMSKPGTIEMILDLNGVDGYQSSTEDVVLVDEVRAGVDTIFWDGRDGLGNFYPLEDTVFAIASFSSGVTHLPIFDDEGNDAGIIVNKIKPISSSNITLYYDDEDLTDGVENVEGEIQDGHGFPYYNFGNNNTVNTWWDGYKIDTLEAFVFSVDEILPVELVYFKANIVDKQTELEWLTATELNNDYFMVERSDNGSDFEQISRIQGAGTSSRSIKYEDIDRTPPEEVIYYRLRQVDFDGKYTYSNIVAVTNDNTSESICELEVNPNPCIGRCEVVLNNCAEENSSEVKFSVFDALGNVVYSSINENMESGSAKFSFDVQNNLKAGVYIFRGGSDNKVSTKKVILNN